MVQYDEQLTLEQARARYFVENDFNPAYDDRWVKLRFGRRKLPLFPNTKARVAAVRIHDLHHVIAEYETTWLGEGEIAGFELGSGCGPYLAAWVLNLAGFGIGFAISPRRVLRAFVRGRKSRNLYREGFDSSRLAQRLGDVRRELGLDRAVPTATSRDLLSFAGFVLLGALYAFGGMASFAVSAFAMWKQPPPRPPAARTLPAPAERAPAG